MNDYGDASGPTPTNPGGPRRGRTRLERAVDNFFDVWFGADPNGRKAGLSDAINEMLDARNAVSYDDANLFARRDEPPRVAADEPLPRAEARPVETDR